MSRSVVPEQEFSCRYLSFCTVDPSRFARSVIEQEQTWIEEERREILFKNSTNMVQASFKAHQHLEQQPSKPSTNHQHHHHPT